MTLGPGASATLIESLHVSHGDLSSTSCNVLNTVKLVTPPGGAASATDIIKSPNCIPAAPPANAGSNLKITKIGDPCTKHDAATWTCDFVVVVANTTNVPFAGPIELDDTNTLGAIVVSAPWTCTNAPPVGNDKHKCTNPSVTIGPNSSVSINMKVVFLTSAITLCKQDNTVTIVTPAGGSPTNTNAADDTATASATVANALCKPVAPLGSTLKLTKTAVPNCQPSGTGSFICSYSIFVHNFGPTTVTEKFAVADQFQPFIKFAQTGVPFSWNCTGAPASGGVSCTTLKPEPLIPGGSLELKLNFEVAASNATPGKCKLPNTATLVGVVGNPAASTATATAKIPMVVDPVKGSVPCDPPSLTLTKIADPQTCVKVVGGFQCSYKVSVASNGPDPFHGALAIQETLASGSSLVKVSSDWTCTPGGPTVVCEHAFLDIPVGQSLVMSATLFVPDANVKPGACQVPNRAALAFDFGPLRGNQSEASASASIDSPLCRQALQQCPGGLRLEGTQCKCPQDTMRTADNRCVVGPPVALRCAPPEIGVYPNCALPVCPAGTRGVYPDCVAIGPRCPLDTHGVYPNCVANAPPVCPPGTQGIYPNCARIVARECPPRTHGVYPSCAADAPAVCPSGTQGVYPNCAAIFVRRCPPRTHGVYPYCVADAPRFCPPGTRGMYPACSPIVVRECPPRTHGVYPDCAADAPAVCPSGTQGLYPNCRRVFVRTCPPRTHGEYPRCVADYQPTCPSGGLYPNCASNASADSIQAHPAGTWHSPYGRPYTPASSLQTHPAGISRQAPAVCEIGRGGGAVAA